MDYTNPLLCLMDFVYYRLLRHKGSIEIYTDKYADTDKHKNHKIPPESHVTKSSVKSLE